MTLAQIRQMPNGRRRRAAILAFLQSQALRLNAQDGMAVDDPDLRWLVRRRMVIIRRTRPAPKWSRRTRHLGARHTIATLPTTT